MDTVPGIWSLLAMGLLPFIIGDMIKIGGAAALAKAITPKEPFNDGENLLIMKKMENILIQSGSEPIIFFVYKDFRVTDIHDNFVSHMGRVISFLKSNPFY